MANITVLNAVSTNTLSSGTSVTGPSVLMVNNLLVGESISWEIADTDTAASYKLLCQQSGPEPRPVRCDHPGTYYLRARLYGVASGRSGTVTAIASQ